MRLFSRLCILLLLATLIATPPIVNGLVDLAHAQASLNSSDASHYYESAARLLFWRTDLYEQAGLRAADDPIRALLLLTTALHKGQLTTTGKVGLGDALMGTGDADKALQVWEDLFASNLEGRNTSPRLVHEYHARRQYIDEERVLTQWLKVEPDNPTASEALGLILAASASPAALPLLETASAVSAENRARLENLLSALKTLESDLAYRLAKCGQALAGLDEWQLAEQAFSHAVDTNPRYAIAWAWLGLTRQHNQTAGALKALEYALSLEQQSGPIHAIQGTFWQQAGELEKARLEFEMATKIEPGNPAWWLALANSTAQDDLVAALYAYNQAVNLAPQEAGYWYALATFSVENNAYLEDYGLNAALRAYALEPNNPDYIDMLGRAEMSLGQWDSAEVMFKKAIETGSTGPIHIYHFHLGLLYLQTGRFAEGKQQFELTREFDPQGSYGAQSKKILENYFPQN